MNAFLRKTRRGWMIFNEADKGGGNGGGGGGEGTTTTTTTTTEPGKKDGDEPAKKDEAKNPEDEEKQPEPSGSTLEEKLGSSKSIIGNLFSRLKEVAGALTQERAQSQKLESQFNAATQAAESAQKDVQKLKGELADMTTQRNQQETRAKDAESNVSRLEKLAGVLGVDPQKAIEQPNGASRGGSNGEALFQQWQSLKKADARGAAKFFKENKAPIEAYCNSDAARRTPNE